MLEVACTSERDKVLNVADSNNKYVLLDDSYSGSGGYEGGSYLIPHPRETAQKYNNRQRMSYYCNYVKPVVDAHVNPIFNTLPQRSYSSNTIFEKFLEDVDGKGTDLNSFMKKAAHRAKLKGTIFIVVDNEYIDTEKPISVKRALEKRIYPYLYLVNPENIVSFSTDKFGNLIFIKYRLEYKDIDDDGNIVNLSETWTWKKDKWFKSNADNESLSGENKLGVIPIIPLFGAKNENDDTLPQSDIFPIAKTNLAIYNACSELRERNRNQAFSILTYPVGEGAEYDAESDVTQGTEDMLVYDATNTSNKPEYINPAAEPSQMLSDEIMMMVKEIYRMASLQLVTGVQAQTSGLAKEWDNQQLFQTISEFAKNVEKSEEKVVDIFSRYINAQLDYKSDYNHNFGIIDATETLNIATQGLALNISPMYNLFMKMKVAKDTLKDLDDEELNEVLKDIKNDPTSTDPINTEPTVLSYAAKS